MSAVPLHVISIGLAVLTSLFSKALSQAIASMTENSNRWTFRLPPGSRRTLVVEFCHRCCYHVLVGYERPILCFRQREASQSPFWHSRNCHVPHQLVRYTASCLTRSVLSTPGRDGWLGQGTVGLQYQNTMLATADLNRSGGSSSSPRISKHSESTATDTL